MNEALTVFIVDDDPAVRDSLSLLLGIHGYRIAPFADAESFLGAYRPDWQGCLLLDLRMPGMDGLTLQTHLQGLGSRLQVVVMTGHGDVASARAAFRAEAVDFLEKPLEQDKLLATLAEACARSQQLQQRQLATTVREEALQRLTPREQTVLEQVVAGRHNREIAAELSISPRTVEVHKARLMDKLGVRSVPDLVRFCLRQEEE